MGIDQGFMRGGRPPIHPGDQGKKDLECPPDREAHITKAKPSKLAPSKGVLAVVEEDVSQEEVEALQAAVANAALQALQPRLVELELEVAKVMAETPNTTLFPGRERTADLAEALVEAILAKLEGLHPGAHQLQSPLMPPLEPPP